MTTTTTKKPTIDFSQWTREEETRPRTLREIANEVEFPFAAKAVLPAERSADCDLNPIEVGTTCRFVGVSEKRPGAFTSDIHVPGYDLPLAAYADVPRWILVGDRT